MSQNATNPNALPKMTQEEFVGFVNGGGSTDGIRRVREVEGKLATTFLGLQQAQALYESLLVSFLTIGELTFTDQIRSAAAFALVAGHSLELEALQDERKTLLADMEAETEE